MPFFKGRQHPCDFKCLICMIAIVCLSSRHNTFGYIYHSGENTFNHRKIILAFPNTWSRSVVYSNVIRVRHLCALMTHRLCVYNVTKHFLKRHVVGLFLSYLLVHLKDKGIPLIRVCMFGFIIITGL